MSIPQPIPPGAFLSAHDAGLSSVAGTGHHGPIQNLFLLAKATPVIPSKLPRKRLQGPGSMEVAVVLDDLNRTLKPGRGSDMRELIDACMHIAAWADYCSEPATALGYVKAAIRFSELAPLRAGRHAAQRGEESQAERLFLLAINIGERAGEWEQVVSSWTQLGKLYRMAADYERMATAHGNALTLSRVHRLRRHEAIALHNLAVLAFERKESARGLLYARQALDAYRGDLNGIRKLANDLAWYWMTSENAYARALPIFEALLPLAADDPADDQIDFTANFGRAAGGAQDAQKFQRACEGVDHLAGRAARARVAGAYLDLAEGAYLLHRVDQAEEFAHRAKELAGKKFRKYAREADQLLSRLRTSKQAAVSGLDLPPLVEARLDEFAERLLATLRS